MVIAPPFPQSETRIPHAFSVDLEEWHQTELARRTASGQAVPTSDLASQTRMILDLLEKHGARATFFVVGELLGSYPKLIQEIQERDHEIGCHGQSHRPLHDLGAAGLEVELSRFRELSRSILGDKGWIRGFRAPSFSLNERTRWAIPILTRWGFDYDSSIFPMRTPLYGVRKAPVGIHRIGNGISPTGSIGPLLHEFPPTVFECTSFRIPVGGGIYLRLLPLRLSLLLLGRIARQRPLLVYIHPWEVGRTDLRQGARWTRMIGSAGSHSMPEKLEHLLERFRFVALEEVLFNGASNEP